MKKLLLVGTVLAILLSVGMISQSMAQGVGSIRSSSPNIELKAGTLGNGTVWANVKGLIVTNASSDTIGSKFLNIPVNIVLDPNTVFWNAKGKKISAEDLKAGDIINVYALQSSSSATTFTASIVRDRSR